MSTTNGGPAADHRGQSSRPQLNVLAQYIKDLSFENPNAPRSLQQQQQQPQINIQINVNAKPLADTDYRGRAQDRRQGRGRRQLCCSASSCSMPACSASQNVPQDKHARRWCMIECPRLLFPFAREIIATAVRNGGFPPLMLDPVDFVALYRQKHGRAAQPHGRRAAGAA